MLKKIITIIIFSSLIISCKDAPKNTDKPSLKSFPSIGLSQKKVVNSVGFIHKSKDIVVTNSFTGNSEKSCGKTNITNESEEYSENSKAPSNCNVKILNIKENQEYIALLKRMESFKGQVHILNNGEKQIASVNLVSIASYKGSCGSLVNSGGDQIESQVDCFSTEAQDCARWVDNGWNFVKDYPPCDKYYD